MASDRRQPIFCRGRADCENRIKELKYDFGAGSFNMRDFWATEAALNTVMLAYNLMSLMPQVLLKSSVVKHWSPTVQHTLQTLRYKLFAKLAYTTTESRKTIRNLVIAMQQRTWMQGLWDAAKAFDRFASYIYACLFPVIFSNEKSRFLVPARSAEALCGYAGLAKHGYGHVCRRKAIHRLLRSLCPSFISYSPTSKLGSSMNTF